MRELKALLYQGKKKKSKTGIGNIGSVSCSKNSTVVENVIHWEEEKKSNLASAGFYAAKFSFTSYVNSQFYIPFLNISIIIFFFPRHVKIYEFELQYFPILIVHLSFHCRI